MKGMKVEEAWPILQEAIDKKIEMIEGIKEDNFSAQELMNIYTITYNIATDCLRNGIECQNLYDRYNKVLQYYISSKVLPILKGMKEDILVQEVLIRWNNYKRMTKWLRKFFLILERQRHITFKCLPNLQEASYSIFFKLALDVEVRKSLVGMIHRHSKGEKIDQELLMDAINMYVEIGNEYYEQHFKYDILKEAHKFYCSYY
ncbi:putative cullin-like protein 2 [Impatiens glandulifera]|uniref:putative cullin-like protein 2 n=1 Tax=Impatiens glandulifera TaxID=253017 RepID=UPI001FB0CE29|nr:putative cullin-like protein 2 [Impatiens glandulifera]